MLHSIELQGRTVAYRLRRSATARCARLHVGSDGVRVVLPRRAPLKHATRLLIEQADWLFRHLDLAADRLARATEAAGLGPGQLLLDGQPTTVRVQLHIATRPTVTRAADALVVRVASDPAVAVPALEAWFRRTARRTFLADLSEFAHVSRKKHAKLIVRDQRTRWGSCSSTGTISLNWRLLMCPPAVRRYVVAHELVHLDIPNHSRRFWATLRAACPETDRHRRWLREHEVVIARPLDTIVT